MHGRVFLLTLCVLTVTAGCSTRGADEGKTILSYTRWGDPSEMESTRELIAQFEKENPDVAVRVDVVSWEQYWQKMKTAVVTDTAQDVWLMSAAYVEEYASSGHLLDLMPFIRADATFKEDDYFPYAFDAYCFAGEGDAMRPVPFGQGALYAFTRDYNCSLLYYNRDHFDAQGLAYPTFDWTWDDLLRAAKVLTIDFDGDGFTDQWGYGGLEYSRMARVIGGNTMDLERHKSTYSTPLVIKTIAFLQDLIYKHKVHPPPTIRIHETESFVTGKVSMMVSGVWNIRQYNTSEYLWDIAPIPVDVPDRKRTMSGGGVAHCIYRKTRNKKDAWKLVKFLSSDLSQRELGRSGTSVPVLKAAAFSEDFLAPFDCPRKESYNAIWETFKGPRAPGTYSKGYLVYTRHAQNIMDGVWRNNRTPEEACRMIDEKTDEVLREHYPQTAGTAGGT
ncbi:MAG TPA: sugar ABC transporter substrate-binding protein [Planctomycetota bacterium]|nr:sugar ABC transporter substrate-binding protein [Planctomycetota bacterium]